MRLLNVKMSTFFFWVLLLRMSGIIVVDFSCPCCGVDIHCRIMDGGGVGE